MEVELYVYDASKVVLKYATCLSFADYILTVGTGSTGRYFPVYSSPQIGHLHLLLGVYASLGNPDRCCLSYRPRFRRNRVFLWCRNPNILCWKNPSWKPDGDYTHGNYAFANRGYPGVLGIHENYSIYG